MVEDKIQRLRLPYLSSLDAMANHGILPRDGKNITMPFLVEKLEKTWNLSPTFCRDTCNAVVKLCKKEAIDLGYDPILFLCLVLSDNILVAFRKRPVKTQSCRA